MATSAYSNYLSNPSVIPRMSGETEADALARMQRWNDEAIRRTELSNAARLQYNTVNAGAPNFKPMDYREYGAPLPIDNYISGSGMPAESYMRTTPNYTPRTGPLGSSPAPTAPSVGYTQNGFTAGGGSSSSGGNMGSSASQGIGLIGGGSTSNSNAAMVDALRQKPNRFAGFGMGTDEGNSLAPKSPTTKVQAVNLANTSMKKIPGSLF